ncbi:MAG: hypothetical protein QM831_29590 [Kofleriaceae bacterium]
MRWAVSVLAVAACGRFDFDGHSPDAPLSPDAKPFSPLSNGCTSADSGPFTALANFPTAGEGGYGVWSASPFLVEADTTGGVHALTFDGTAFTERGHLDGLGWVEAVVGNTADPTQYFVSAPGTGFYIVNLAIDGQLSIASSDLTIAEARHAWSDGTNIFVPVGADGVHALHFAGAITDLGSIGSRNFSQSVIAKDGYIYLADDAVFRVLSFDGTTFMDVGEAIDHPGYARMWISGSTVFAATGDGAVAMHWDGAALTTLDHFATPVNSRDIWSDGQHVFLAAEEDGLYALNWDGAHFTQVDHVPVTGAQTLGVFGDGTYIYANDYSGGLTAYSGFACTAY